MTYPGECCGDFPEIRFGVPEAGCAEDEDDQEGAEKPEGGWEGLEVGEGSHVRAIPSIPPSVISRWEVASFGMVAEPPPATNIGKTDRSPNNNDTDAADCREDSQDLRSCQTKHRIISVQETYILRRVAFPKVEERQPAECNGRDQECPAGNSRSRSRCAQDPKPLHIPLAVPNSNAACQTIQSSGRDIQGGVRRAQAEENHGAIEKVGPTKLSLTLSRQYDCRMGLRQLHLRHISLARIRQSWVVPPDGMRLAYRRKEINGSDDIGDISGGKSQRIPVLGLECSCGDTLDTQETVSQRGNHKTIHCELQSKGPVLVLTTRQ